MKILGIETSCDETAVAIVDDQKNILSHCLNSQIELHQEYGGVVPELAARCHVETLDTLIEDSLKQANLTLNEIDGFAVTAGPGLIGGVIVGLMAAKTLASVYKKPFIAVNHLEAHALTVRITDDVKFPYLLLLVSGGHCQILLAKGVGDYKKIGETTDDALGEAFDKVAQMLGLPYPGGPVIEKIAIQGDSKRFKFPRPLIDGASRKNNPQRNNPQKDNYKKGNFKGNDVFNFSFSGLKTAVRRQIEKLTNEEFSHFTSPQKLNQKDKNDIAASFQKTVIEVILNRLENVMNEGLGDEKLEKLVIAGGVAANRYIFSNIQNWAKKHNLEVVTPPIDLCTDNAVMIAWTGVEKLKLGMTNNLNFKPKARWPLGDNTI